MEISLEEQQLYMEKWKLLVELLGRLEPYWPQAQSIKEIITSPHVTKEFFDEVVSLVVRAVKIYSEQADIRTLENCQSTLRMLRAQEESERISASSDIVID